MYILCCKHANLRPADAVGERKEAEANRTEKINEVVSGVRQVVFLLRPPATTSDIVNANTRTQLYMLNY